MKDYYSLIVKEKSKKQFEKDLKKTKEEINERLSQPLIKKCRRTNLKGRRLKVSYKTGMKGLYGTI